MEAGGFRHRIAWALAAVLFAAGAVGGGSLRGHRARTFAAPPVARALGDPAEAGPLWRSLGLRGRTLLLFDHYPHADVGAGMYSGEPRSPASFVEYGVFHGVLRRVYLVVPDDRWAAFRRQDALYKVLRPVPGVAEAVELFTFSGAPLIALTPAALPALGEEVLVYVNAAAFDPAWVEDLLARRGLRSDVRLTWRGGAGG